MESLISWLQMTELDDISSLELAERIEQFNEGEILVQPRQYPGYPTTSLPRPRRRWLTRLDAVLYSRRCRTELSCQFPNRQQLSRVLWFSHGISGDDFRGPTPSAGGLQSIELYVVHWQSAWLPAGVYHYNRLEHALSQLSAEATPMRWQALVPSLRGIQGGSLLWLIVGDVSRVSPKYGNRAERFLLLEAGHLMQNLCLVSTSLNLTTTPLGGILEQHTSGTLGLLPTDRLLYAGVCG